MINVNLKLKNLNEWVAYMEDLKLKKDEINIEEAVNFDFKFDTEPITN